MSETEIERERCLRIVRLQRSDSLPIESQRLLCHIESLVANGYDPGGASDIVVLPDPGDHL